jgi:hypothetical protein
LWLNESTLRLKLRKKDLKPIKNLNDFISPLAYLTLQEFEQKHGKINN